MRELTQDDVGSHVIFTDPIAVQHDALITAVHGTKCMNLVYVVGDKNATDNYGRKTNKQYTSVMHGNVQQAHGNFWMWPGERRDIGQLPQGTQDYLNKPNPVTE